METTTKSDLKEFRSETKRWLEENCPTSMRTPPKEFADLYWGGRNSTFSSEDQKNWFTKMLEKKMDCSLLGYTIWWWWFKS